MEKSPFVVNVSRMRAREELMKVIYLAMTKNYSHYTGWKIRLASMDMVIKLLLTTDARY
jgi:hypothetical protein